MSNNRKTLRRVGDVIVIPIGDGRIAFGLVLGEPLVAFFDYSSNYDVIPTVEEIIGKRVAFQIMVMNRPLVDGLWPVIGRVSVPAPLLEAPWFFKKDPINGKVSITKTGSEEVTPEPGQVAKLERAAVWDPQHVVDRLRDHFDGRPNRWVESMKWKP